MNLRRKILSEIFFGEDDFLKIYFIAVTASKSSQIFASGALVRSETTTMKMQEVMNAGSSS